MGAGRFCCRRYPAIRHGPSLRACDAESEEYEAARGFLPGYPCNALPGMGRTGSRPLRNAPGRQLNTLFTHNAAVLLPDVNTVSPDINSMSPDIVIVWCN